MEICVKCNTQIADKEKFCSQCGAKKGEYTKINKPSIDNERNVETCGKCNTPIAGNEKFCSLCGARKGEYTQVNKPSIDNVGILEIVRKLFRGFVGFLIVAILIIAPLTGAIIGNSMSSSWNNYIFQGFIIGLLIGFVVVVLFGGLIVTIIEIGDNLRYLRDEAERKKNQ